MAIRPTQPDSDDQHVPGESKPFGGSHLFRRNKTLKEVREDACLQQSEDFDTAMQRDPDLPRKAVAVAYLHHLMFNGRPANLIARFLDPLFAGVLFQHQQSKFLLVCAVAASMCVIIIAPWIYGLCLMKDPCNPHEVHIDNRTAELAMVGCHVQEFMKSPGAMILGPAAMLFVLAAWMMGPLWITCGARRSLRPIKIAVFNWIRRDTPKLWYQPFSLEGRALALNWTVGVWFLLNAEFLVIGLLLRDGVSLVAGYTLSKLWCLLANQILAPPEVVITMINAELTKTEFHALGNTMMRLFEHSSACFYLSSAELDALYKLPNMREDVEQDEMYWFGWRELDEKFRFHTSMKVSDLESPITSIYIPDLDIVIPVQELADLDEGTSSDGSEC